MLGILLWQVLIPRPYYTGSASVGVHGIAVEIPKDQKMCTSGMHLPASTGIVRFVLFSTQPHVRVMEQVQAGGQTVSTYASGTPGPSTQAVVDASIPTRPAHPASVPATICITPLEGPVGVAGMPGLQLGVPPLQVNGTPIENSASVWFLPAGHGERSLVEQASAVFSRAALFRPGIVGAWTYPLLLFVILPLSWILALLMLVRGAAGRALTLRGRALPQAGLIAVIAFLNAGSWALITPAFQTPDEPDHFGYVQYVGETGHAASPQPSTRASSSTDQILAEEGAHTYGVISSPAGLPPWLSLYQEEWKRYRASVPHPRDNGGGFTPGASGHAPPYYALEAAGYELVRSQSVFSQLTVMRLISALLGAIAAACAFGVVLEILPRQRACAVGAGLLVAFQPMFGFMSGAVNNDNGINACAALTLYLLVRALRRGLSVRLAAGLAAALALAPLMKETGYEIYPVAAVGLAGLLWRYRRQLQARAWATFIATFAAIEVAWKLVRPLFYPIEHGHNTAAGAISATSAVSVAEHMPLRFLEYLWELFLPRLPFMGELFPAGWPFFQIYIERGWGAFGWYEILFPRWVYIVIVMAMVIVGLLALRTAWSARRFVWSRGFEMLVIVLFPVCVLVAVEAAFFAPNGGRTVVAEQGRYIFPAIGALAAIAVAGTFGLGRRLQIPLLTTLVVAMIALSYGSQLLTLAGFYT